jgi:hypothetical protein
VTQLARPADWRDAPVLPKERRGIFLVQRLTLLTVILASIVGVLFLCPFLLHMDGKALSYAAEHLADHAKTNADAISAVQDQEQLVLARAARGVVSDESAPFDDKARRMANLDQIFQMSRAWKTTAQRVVIRRDEKEEALTYFVSPLTGKMVPLNPTKDGSLDRARVAGAGGPNDFDALMALARGQAEGRMPKDVAAVVQRDVAIHIQTLLQNQGGTQ